MGTQIFLHQKQTPHTLLLAPHQIKSSTNHLQSITRPEFGGVPAAARLDAAPELILLAASGPLK
jgi:hypothetical protein